MECSTFKAKENCKSSLRSIRFFVSLFYVVLLTSCTSIPLASETEDSEAKKFEIPAEKSRIYVFRNEILEAALKVSITLDSKFMGQTGPFTYFSWDVDPGRHLVSCLGKEIRTVEVFAKKGKAIFVKQEMLLEMGGPSCAVYEVSDDDGRIAVKSSKLGKPMDL